VPPCQSTGVLPTQLAVGAKINEIAMSTKLLDTIDRTDVMITADSMHCQRGTTAYIVSWLRGHWTIKNRSQ
jgi:predicted transposase YbfD/YdcC